jgi:hypothetical protein
MKSIIMILIVYMILFMLLGLVYKRMKTNIFNKISFLVLLMGFIGAILTYYDFHHTITHKLLGSKFHFGGYIFWMGYIIIPSFFLFNKKIYSDEKKRWNFTFSKKRN